MEDDVDDHMPAVEPVEPVEPARASETTKADRGRWVRGVGSLWHAAVGTVQANWPGQPIEFEDEEDALLVPAEPAAGVARPSEPVVATTATAADAYEPPLKLAVTRDGTDSEESAEAAEGLVEVRTRRLAWLLAPARLPLAGVRGLRAVGHGVYTALADPITNADEAVRERRAARVRRVGQVAVSTALALVLIYAIFPVREYMDQRSATDRQNERLDVLSEANEQESEYVEWLRSEEGEEWLAREYGYTYPDEESYTVVPNPDEE